ncbi:MAG: glycosyltransferase family 4 protein [Proteobacteria bacterium]|nr:glycosyltransferase family 4 protein [Pseudomonadota bacterium]
MRIVYYTFPSFLELSLHRIRSLSKHVELHVVVELPPEGRNSNILNIPHDKQFFNIIEPFNTLSEYFPEKVNDYWKDAASCNLAVYQEKKSVHPLTWYTSYQISSYIKKLKPDILFIEDISLRFSWSICRLRNIPIVATIHDPVPHSGERNWRKGLAYRLVFKKITHFILMNSRLTTAFSDRYGITPDRINTIPLGTYDIFREWIQTPVHTEQKTILFFGRLSVYKGIEVLYKAAPIVAEKIPDVNFVIAGKPVAGYSPSIPPKLSNNGRFEIIETYITNVHMAELFQRARVVVCPYIDATQSGVLLTAYAFNKPVIGTDTGGLAEYIWHQKTGLLIPPSDKSALSQALIDILSDEKTIDTFESGIGEIKTKWLAWDRIAEKTIRIFKQNLI